jgi:hypothetical protein
MTTVIFPNDEIRKMLMEKLKPAAMEAIRNTVAEAGLHAVARAKYYCPVDTGRLRASIVMNYSGSGMTAVGLFVPKKKDKDRAKADRVTTILEPTAGADEVKGVIGTNVEYAPWIETGTKRGIQGIGFLGQGVREGNEKVKTLLAKWLKRIKIVKEG